MKLNSGDRQDRLLYMSFIKEIYIMVAEFYNRSKNKDKELKESLDNLRAYMERYEL